MLNLFCYWVMGIASLAIPFQKKGSIPVNPEKLVVMSYNVHHCNPPSRDNLIDISAIAKTIKKQKPDLVALQEIDLHTQRCGNVNQAEVLAKELNMHYFFGKAIDYEGGEYGVAIMSKFTITNALVHRLPSNPDTRSEPRILLTVTVKLPGGDSIRFGCTHLDAMKDSTNRQLQIKEITNIASTETLPMIIAGDFNATSSSAVIRELDEHFKRTCLDCEPTIPSIKPVKTIDFIAFRPSNTFTAVKNKVVDEKYASDHLPVVSTIKFIRK